MNDPAPWFYVPRLAEGVLEVELDPREARHAAGARRLTQGDAATLFNGRGLLAVASIASIGRRAAVASVTRLRRASPPAAAVHLACALPKGDRQSVLLSMAAQLGMTRFTPLMAQHAVVAPGRGFAGRAQRICIEACKQGRRPYLPEIAPAASIQHIIDESALQDATMLIAHPGGPPLARAALNQRAITVLIGPEGGFTGDEIAVALDARAKLVSLGESILRIETAAVAALAWIALSRAG